MMLMILKLLNRVEQNSRNFIKPGTTTTSINKVSEMNKIINKKFNSEIPIKTYDETLKNQIILF